MTHETKAGSNNHAFTHRLIAIMILLIGVLLIWKTLHIFLLIFLSGIFAVFLHRSAVWIHARAGIGIRWGTALVTLVLIATSTVLIILMAPQIADQVDKLTETLPDSWQHFREAIAQNRFGGWLMTHLPPMQRLSGSLGGLMHQATAWLYSALGALIGVLVIFVLGLYLAYDAALYTHGITTLVSKDLRERATTTLQAIASTLYWWVVGRLCAMLIIGILTFLGLWLLDVPLALTLGLFAAVMSFIPNIGPLIATIPAFLLALQTGWSQAAYVTLLYAAIQAVESYLITPFVQRQMISMPPALILSAQLIMGVIQGVLGILVATPLVAVIIVMTKMLYLQDGNRVGNRVGPR